MIDNKYDIEIDGQGYIVKKDSKNNQFARQFINQIALDELSYQDFSFWKIFAQSNWHGGFGEEDLINDTVFYESSEIDVHKKIGEFRLSKKLSDNLDTTPVISDPIVVQVSYGGEQYICAGQYVFKSVDGTEGSYALDQDVGATITDATIFNGYLYVFMGTAGYYRYDSGGGWVQESDGTQSPAGENEKITFATVWSPSGNVSYIFGTYNNVLRKGEWDGSKIVWDNLKTFMNDVVCIPNKPVIYNYNLYFWIRFYNSNLGSSQMWVYNGDSVIEVTGSDTDETVANRMQVYNNTLFYFSVGVEAAYLKTFDGSAFAISKRLDSVSAGALYDTFLYGDDTLTGSPTGIVYDLLSSSLSDPVSWAIYDEKLLFTCKSAAPANYLYEFDGNGWSRRNDFTLDADATYNLGVYNKQLYIGTDIGELFKITTDYAESGYLISSIYDANLLNTDKLLKEIQLKIAPLPSGTSIQVSYDLEQSGFFTSATMPTLIAGQTEVRVPISTENATISGKKIRIKVTLTTIDETTSPVIKDIIVRYAPVPDNLIRYQLTLLTINGLRLYDGSIESESALDLARKVYSLRDNKRLILFKDFDYVETTLGSNISYTDTTISLTDASGFPKRGQLKVGDERILYTGKTGNSLTGCVRGYKGTIAASHTAGDAVDNAKVVFVQDAIETEHLLNAFDGYESIVQVVLDEA